jgi:hypothetical protein
VLSWNANPESDLAGYEVVMRETTSPDWTNVIKVGNVTPATLDIAKDNVQLGPRGRGHSRESQPGRFPPDSDYLAPSTERSP